MHYEEDRRPMKDEFLLDLLAPAEARSHANPGGITYANLAMPDADVLTALGARFDDRVTGKVDIKGDVIRTGLLSILLARKSPLERAEWRATSQGWKEKYSFV
ncbi:hypothetical protein PtB15_17B94 [Puccinia triticina]|nr:hypothetical protein PtB15_17B94 [Puccinia triticina]